MKTNEFVKFLTETFFKRIDERQRSEKKSKEKKREGESREQVLFNLFGVIPNVIQSYRKKSK